MYNFITIFVKCPACGKSLMDQTKRVDNETSINLIVKSGDSKGLLWLSSIYGSFNYTCEIEVKNDEIANFYCPHCRAHLPTRFNCSSCDAPMIDFNLEMGGRVSICSRNGCKNHAIEFEDLSLALRRLYQQYGFRGREYPKNLDLRTVDPVSKNEQEAAEFLETGTFLMAYCPHCRKSLIENDMLKLKITNDEEGLLMLSPYLNAFTSKSTIYVPEDKVVKDLRCWHCDKTLIESEKSCGKCGSPTAKISISARTKLIDFYICTKKGCKWHGLNEDDLFEIRLEDSDEW